MANAADYRLDITRQGQAALKCKLLKQNPNALALRQHVMVPSKCGIDPRLSPAEIKTDIRT
jgi:hypothetical protein